MVALAVVVARRTAVAAVVARRRVTDVQAAPRRATDALLGVATWARRTPVGPLLGEANSLRAAGLLETQCAAPRGAIGRGRQLRFGRARRSDRLQLQPAVDGVVALPQEIAIAPRPEAERAAGAAQMALGKKVLVEEGARSEAAQLLAATTGAPMALGASLATRRLLVRAAAAARGGAADLVAAHRLPQERQAAQRAVEGAVVSAEEAEGAPKISGSRLAYGMSGSERQRTNKHPAGPACTR